MNRTLDFLRGRLAGPPDAADRHLLDRFLDHRDEAAFTELVRRHGPLVWGVCRRRLNSTHDAEDAFQATFLVLVRRAAAPPPDTPVGPWLHRVAVMTTRNVARGNRRRAGVAAPLEHDAPAPSIGECDHDIDAALLALPERERVAVVLCHLQGFTRKEAAARLGCPEGTLSARLSRALGRLRVKLATAVVAVPVGLSAATVRAAEISLTSSLTAAGVSPAVAGVTNGVLRMFWVKKLVAASALAALLGGGLMIGYASDPAASGAPVSAQLAAQPDDPAAEAKRIAEKIARLKKEQVEAEAALQRLNDEDAKRAIRARAERLEVARKTLVAKLPADVVIDVTHEVGKGPNWGVPPYRVREAIGGKVEEVHCFTVPMLEVYLTRAFAAPNGPKTVALTADKATTQEQLAKVFAACAKAGFKKATVTLAEIPPAAAEKRALWLGEWVNAKPQQWRVMPDNADPKPSPPAPLKPGEVDLKDYLPKPADVGRKW
jgi:RNA polymerase sigma factor (sigma-70 family)